MCTRILTDSVSCDPLVDGPPLLYGIVGSNFDNLCDLVSCYNSKKAIIKGIYWPINASNN